MDVLRKLLFFLLVVFMFFSLSKNYFDYRKNIKFYADYRKDYEAEKKLNTELRTKALKQADPYEVEKTIRNRLNLTKPNEVVIILPETKPTPSPVPPTPVPVYQQWIDLFVRN